VNRTSTG